MKIQGSCGASTAATSARRATRPAIAAMAAILFVLGGCTNSGHDTTNGGTNVAVQTAAEIMRYPSSPNYNSNVYGIITGQTLGKWIDNWVANRPPGVTGHLIILQTGSASCTAYTTTHKCQTGYGLPTTSNGGVGFAGMEYVAHDNVNVFAYDVSGSAWVMWRNNGVSNTSSMVLDGPSTDALLNKYNINPTQDMVVCAMGQGSYVGDMLIGRCYYLLRYWGVPHNHLAILDGGIDNSLDSAGGYATFTNGLHTPGTGYFSPTPSTPPNDGVFSVKDIPIDNTALQASLQEMLGVASGTYTPSGGYLIVDARSPAEYNGVQDQTPGQIPGCTTATGGTCYVGFEGHVHGAVNLNYINLLYANDWYDGPGAAADPYADNSFGNRNAASSVPGDLNGDGILNAQDASYGYLDKSWLQKVYTDALGTTVTPSNGMTFKAVGYSPGETVYTYCRTTYRAMITGIAAGVVLGYPLKWYDGAWIEWGELGYTQNMAGTYDLPANSPWRTDRYTDDLNYNPPADVEVAPVTNPYSTTANAVIEADKAYKTGASTASSTSSAGNPAPANPCGG